MPNLMYFGQQEYGHMIAGISIFNYLKRKYGNEYVMYFVVNHEWHEKLKKQDPSIQTLLLKPIENSDVPDEEESFDLLANSFMNCTSLKDQEAKIVPICAEFFLNSTKYYRNIQPQVEAFFQEIDFHLIVVDSVLPVPFLFNKKTKSGHHIPYVSVVTMSLNGVGRYPPDIPPPCSLMNSQDKHLFTARHQMFIEHLAEYVELHNKYLEEEGTDLKLKPGCFQFPSPDLNVYLVPEEISYISNDKRDAIEKPNTVRFDGEWLRIDSTIDSSFTVEPFQLPKEFESLPGKLVFFSLGSNFSSNVVLMQKILDVLGEMKDMKFIVSMGKNGHKLRLPENCYGDKWLPQKSILKIVDMMITHGGNNSLTECFHFGVPMLVLPLFVDQLNNGPRLLELGYADYVDLFDFNPKKLKEGILKVLNDKGLKERMKKASERIQRNNGLSIVADRFVQMMDSIQSLETKSNPVENKIKSQTEV